MQNLMVSQPATIKFHEAVRLYYLDWLRVIAILGVFLIHAILAFTEVDFHIKNVEQSSPLTIFTAFFYPWGMPLVFVIAGAGSWFALQRRTTTQYVSERFNRLFIPFGAGSILLTPIIFYFEWVHKLQTGLAQSSFLEFVKTRQWEPNPRVFAALGDHLWFIGFLYCLSFLTLPLFHWLKEEKGKPIILTVGIISFLAATAISIVTDEFDLELVPRTPLDWAWWTFFTICSWCWTAFMLFVGIRFLDYSNKWLHYSQEAILPFYVFHLPVIIVIAYFVVQWEAGIPVKLLAVVTGAFALSLGLTEWVIKRAGFQRLMFGMKAT